MSKRKKIISEANILNRYAFDIYYKRLIDIAMSVFGWKNTPDTVDTRFLEMTLISNGRALFFNDDVLGFICLPDASGGRLDIYDTPIDRRAYGVNGYNRELNNKNSVYIFNNLLRCPSIDFINYYASKLAEIDRTIDTNINAQKTPFLIKSSENQRLTNENVYYQYKTNNQVIKVSDDFNGETVSILNTQAPFVSDKLYDLKSQIWNEALTYLGVANVNTQKRERLITDEVQRSLGGTFASRYSKLEARQQACEKINKMFGLNIWCEFKDGDSTK